MLFILCFLPQETAYREEVSVIEWNCIYDYDGRETLSQLIFWERDNSVRDWRGNRNYIQPRKDFATGDWVLIFVDGDKLREIRARSYRVTNTDYDPEQMDRQNVPEVRRRKLRR